MLANLRWKIETQGLKHYDVAKAAGISESKLSRALSGRATLGPIEKERIAAAVSCDDQNWLFRDFGVLPRSYRPEQPEPEPAFACAANGR